VVLVLIVGVVFVWQTMQNNNDILYRVGQSI